MIKYIELLRRVIFYVIHLHWSETTLILNHTMFVQGLALIICDLLSFTHNFALPCWFFYQSFISNLRILKAIDRKKSLFSIQVFFSLHPCPWHTHSTAHLVNAPVSHSLNQLSSEWALAKLTRWNVKYIGRPVHSTIYRVGGPLPYLYSTIYRVWMGRI